VFKKHSDKVLVEGLRKGDDKTLNYLYQNYFGTVKSYIVKNSGTEDDAYDVFQDALMVVFKKFQHNGVELTSDLKGYVFGVARKLWSNQLRIKKEVRSSEYIDVIDDIELEKLLEVPIEQIVQRSFIKLPADCQKVLTMHLEGLSYEEIAKKMDYKSASYARRKKYLSKEELIKIIKSDPDYKDYEDFGL
jgi:RNA polymerase sigma factor (sigma-70 family)